MSAFEVATKFFEACETPLGWQACKQFVEVGAGFAAQAEPVADITSVEAYCEWMYGFGTAIAPGCSYTLHASSFDEANHTAIFFATFHGKHTGDGGPVPPTQQETHSHYVYIIEMSEDAKVKHLTKVWNAPWAMKELGWA